MIDELLKLRIGMKRYFMLRLKDIELDLTYEMVQVLVHLWKTGESNQQDIVDAVQKNKASITSLLDNLEKRQLVIRVEDPSDRRNKIISVTKLGRAYEAKVAPVIDDVCTRIQYNISETQIRKLTDVLMLMQTNLKKG